MPALSHVMLPDSSIDEVPVAAAFCVMCMLVVMEPS